MISEATKRKLTRKIKVGNVEIGGGSPITIQSMTNTPTADVQATIEQIRRLSAAGCEIVRVAANTMEAAEAIKPIQAGINIPLIADIHFNYKLALKALESGVDGLRLNPGNIGSDLNVMKVVDAARERKIPIRIGVNSGSLSKEMVKKYGVNAESIVESALQHVRVLEKANYEEIKISVKASSVPLTLECYRLLSQKVDYPLHLGVTEAGTEFAGTIKSAMGIGTLLAEGIGDTLRVSLTDKPEKEILVGREILKSLHLRKGLKFVSCPTCGRTEIDLIGMAKEVEKRLVKYADVDITVAVMGCVVNGPGEAREADFAIAGGKGEGLLIAKGEILKKMPEDKLVDALINLIEEYVQKL